MTTTQLITAAENEDVFANIMTTLVELAKHEGDFMLQTPSVGRKSISTKMNFTA